MASNNPSSRSRGKGRLIRSSSSREPPNTTSPQITSQTNDPIYFPPGYEPYNTSGFPAPPLNQFPLPPYQFPPNYIGDQQNYCSSQGSQESTRIPSGSTPSTATPTSPTTNHHTHHEWLTETEMLLLKNRRSEVWRYFVLSKDGEQWAKCKTCNSVFTAVTKNGTGHLSRHMKACAKPASDPTQPKISQFHPYGFTYNYERDRDELGKMIVHAEQPFLFSESDAFNTYINKALQPQHKRISRKTVRSAAMKNFLEYKVRLQAELSNLNCRVSLTADSWDSGYKYHYLCVTCHWVDDQWMLQKRIIHFKMLEYPHTGINIAHHLMQAIDEYNLRDKMMSMTFDNATSMTYTANLIKQNLTDVLLDGEALHTRCVCHVLNLCVQDGVRAIGPYYSKIRDAIMSINSSNMRYQEWKSFLKQQKIRVIKIRTDCPTRWNSTYDMLTKAIEYKGPLTLFYNQKFPQNALYDDDWNNCERYMQFLQLLYNMTYCFSTVYNPCAQNFLSNACLLAQLFADHRDQSDYDQYLPAMEKKWRKYYSQIPLIYIFASILDPRQKYENTFMLVDIYFQCMFLDDDVENYKTNVKDQFFALYRVYEAKYGTVPRSGPSQPSKNVSKKAKHLFSQATNLISRFSGDSSIRRTQSDVSELQMYLSYDFTKGMDDDEINSLDLLAWWKQQSSKHPTLAAMARDILAIQVSSVTSERAFSASGRVLDDRRTSLKPETLEMCVCFKDWLDAENRSQDRSYDHNDNEEGTSASGSGSASSQSMQLADDLEGEGEDEDEDEDEQEEGEEE